MHVGGAVLMHVFCSFSFPENVLRVRYICDLLDCMHYHGQVGHDCFKHDLIIEDMLLYYCLLFYRMLHGFLGMKQ